MDQQIAQLQAEIARLNKLITVLLEQNDAQRERIAFLENGNTSPDARNAIAENGKGNPDNSIAVAEKVNGNSDLRRQSIENDKGYSDSWIAYDEIGKGKTTGRIDVSEIGKGNPNELPPLPAFLPLNTANILRLKVLLKKEGFNKVRKTAVANAAQLMLHFYNKGGGGYPELMKLTGLSKFGLGKYIRSLKRRGLIERNGWQQFKVTSHGLGLLKLARCEGEKP